MNYLLVLTINLVGMLIIYSLMAYALVRLRWYHRGVIAVLATIVMAQLFWIVPPMIASESSTLANLMFRFENWLVSAFGVVILCRTVKVVPRQLEDSARMDGCGALRIFWHVLLPFVRRDLVLIALLTVMATTFELIELETALFRSFLPIPGGELVLDSLIMTIPVIVIFLAARRYFDEQSSQQGAK